MLSKKKESIDTFMVYEEKRTEYNVFNFSQMHDQV